MERTPIAQDLLQELIADENFELVPSADAVADSPYWEWIPDHTEHQLTSQQRRTLQGLIHEAAVEVRDTPHQWDNHPLTLSDQGEQLLRSWQSE